MHAPVVHPQTRVRDLVKSRLNKGLRIDTKFTAARGPTMTRRHMQPMHGMVPARCNREKHAPEGDQEACDDMIGTSTLPLIDRMVLVQPRRRHSGCRPYL